MNKLLLVLILIGCDRDAQRASYNISHESDMFRVNRRIVFYNGITDTYLLSIQGYCSINKDSYENQLEVTCKKGLGYKKHFLGISDNVTYFAEHLEASDVSTNTYKIVFKPLTIVPDIEVKL